MLTLDPRAHAEMVAHAYAGYPLEACGLLAGPAGRDLVTAFYPCENVAASARVYTVSPRDHLRAERAAEDHGWEIVGVMHSHTHSDAYPSPTDVASAPDPGWHYLIVSLKQDAPVVRSYRIVDGTIAEERVVRG